jgi:hypothetical protein
MSIESFSPLPLNVFGTWITLLDPSDVPMGMSPNLADIDFFPGGVRTITPRALPIRSPVELSIVANGLRGRLPPAPAV